MTSPFSTFQEFSEAKGPIYTFANNPVMIGILLAICFLMTVYFFYMSFAMHEKQSKAKSPAALGILILAGMVSIVSSLLHTQPSKEPAEARRPGIERTAKGIQPLALLGMMGIGGATVSRQRMTRRPKRVRR